MAASNCGNGPSAAWQLEAVEEQERIRLNLLNLRHRGKWDFVNELQPWAPRRLATTCTRRTSAGFWTSSCPPGPSKDSNSVNSLEQFQEIFHGHQAARRRGLV